jgi:hypothetical protein
VAWCLSQRQCSSATFSQATEDQIFPFGQLICTRRMRPAHMLFDDDSQDLAAVGVASQVVSSTLHAACMLRGCCESSDIMSSQDMLCVAGIAVWAMSLMICFITSVSLVLGNGQVTCCSLPQLRMAV